MNLILSLSAIILFLYGSEAFEGGEYSPFPTFEKLYPLSVRQTRGDYDIANENHLNEPRGPRHKRSAPWRNAEISDSLYSSYSGPVMYRTVEDEFQDPVFIRVRRNSIFPTQVRAASDSSGISGRGVDEAPLRPRAEVVPEGYYGGPYDEDDAPPTPQQRRLANPNNKRKLPNSPESPPIDVYDEKFYGTDDDENIHNIEARVEEDPITKARPHAGKPVRKFGGDALEYVRAEKQRNPFRFNTQSQTPINYNNYRHRSRPEIQPGQAPVNSRPQHPSASASGPRPLPGKLPSDRYPHLTESGKRPRLETVSGKLAANRKHQQRASLDKRVEAAAKKIFVK